jgi:acyl-CoA thioesterase
MSSDDHPRRRNQPLSFVELMALNRVDCGGRTHGSSLEAEKVEHFQSIAPPFAPFSKHAAFGGHVYAQSAYAASQTVDKGFILHVSVLINRHLA